MDARLQDPFLESVVSLLAVQEPRGGKEVATKIDSPVRN